MTGWAWAQRLKLKIWKGVTMIYSIMVLINLCRRCCGRSYPSAWSQIGKGENKKL